MSGKTCLQNIGYKHVYSYIILPEQLFAFSPEAGRVHGGGTGRGMWHIRKKYFVLMTVGLLL